MGLWMRTVSQSMSVSDAGVCNGTAGVRPLTVAAVRACGRRARVAGEATEEPVKLGTFKTENHKALLKCIALWCCINVILAVLLSFL